MTDSASDSPSIFTIGHSTHPIEEFLALLDLHRIALLADVRSFPSSRKWPHFNQAELAKSLAGADMEYRWMKDLGGRRHGIAPESPHRAWTHPAFRSYADYADTEPFTSALAELCAAARQRRTAYMCSEGLWWRCHRRIISDHLTVRGWRALHIMPDGKLSQHQLAPFARVAGGRIIYDGDPAAR